MLEAGATDTEGIRLATRENQGAARAARAHGWGVLDNALLAALMREVGAKTNSTIMW